MMNALSPTELADDLFMRGLPSAQLERLASCARHTVFPADARIFDEGGAADRFWLIRAGRAAVDLHLPGRGRLVVETIGPGEVLGWSWLVEPHEWAFGASVAVGPLEAVEFDARRVRALCSEVPAFGQEMQRRFAVVLLNRLQATRLRLLDIYGRPGG